MSHSQSNNPPAPLDLSYKHIIAIATPVLIANLAMPMQGAIDVAVVGHFPEPFYLAGLGIASQLWLLILVSFNFLQYASSGLAAQALGRQVATGKSGTELADILFRSLGLAVILAAILWLCKDWVIALGLQLLGAQPSSQQAAHTYIDIRYFGIVFELMNYAFIGWFAGQGKTKQMMMVQLLISTINIVLTLSFVYLLDMGLKGVALGTVIGYAIGCSTAFLLARRILSQNSLSQANSKTTKSSQQSLNPQLDAQQNGQLNAQPSIRQRLAEIYALEKMLSLFSLNKDIFIRTILLTLSFAWITRLSAQQGDLVMATNAVLLQVLSISAFALDGVAVAAESLSGQAAARKGHALFIKALKRTGVMTFWLAVGLSVLWLIFLPTFLDLMTDIPSVTSLALEYRYIAILLPIIGAGAYWLDGVMFGLTAGSKIRQVAIIVAAIFFPLTWFIYQKFGSTYAMPVIWFAVYWLLLSRFAVAALMLWRHKSQLIAQVKQTES
ncbi:MATE family efflux transporter [Psychrobacter sp. FDAARGOS_221]|uniref:MATE family efflux transporter n=1 Tax=Psychrobacter sp. FDAARGOS_221 TaxID=1975705 RepID=UPI000BB57D79|nr:MATE family efflux transporter [Psychrobacter sp. FDAARGOS_221]PNK61699.1 MATE family efflux transporter [Psychrobacter sp. FDAARGOS_221]